LLEINYNYFIISNVNYIYLEKIYVDQYAKWISVRYLNRKLKYVSLSKFKY